MNLLYYLFCIFSLCACGGNNAQSKTKGETVETKGPKEDVKYVNSIKLTSPVKNKIYRFHEPLPISFQTKDRFPVDSAVIYVDGRQVGIMGKGVTDYVYPVPAGKTGNHTLKVIAWHPGGKKGVASVNIRVKPDQAPVPYAYEVMKVYPHDPNAYTQGLFYHNGYMYEGTGQYGESSIRKTDMKDGKILSILNIDSQLFGEGITIYGDKIYQITWRSHKGFVYDLKTFSLESTFQYNSEGWGLTTAGDHLIMSDGSNKLYHIAPSGFTIIKEVEVYDHQGPVDQLNELEYADGLVWANIWLTERIIGIDPETGVVKAELDMSSLLKPVERMQLDDKDDVLNGIAYNPDRATFYVTGKRGPKMVEIKIKTQQYWT